MGGSVTSSAALLGFEDTQFEEQEQEHAIAHDLQTPDISDGNLKPFSLSTIQEERTSQMMSPEAAITETLRQQSFDDQESQKSLEKSFVSVGKVDQEGELSLSIGNQEVTLSLYQTPDLSEKDAQNICEMFADEIAESISESNYVELPPLRFTKETAKASNINMEAVIIDIDQQDLQEYESMKMALENIDDLQTECDIEDVSVAEWNEEPVRGTEFETLTCEEILEFDDVAVRCESNEPKGQHASPSAEENISQSQKDIAEENKHKTVELSEKVQEFVQLSENKSDKIKGTEKISKVVGVQKKTDKIRTKETVPTEIIWWGKGDSVLVAGDFNNWHPEEMKQEANGVWKLTLKLPAGMYNLKFVVDGQWVTSESLESISDQEGNVNNRIEVSSTAKSTETIKKKEKSLNESSSENFAKQETDTIKRAPDIKLKTPKEQEKEANISVDVKHNSF